MREPGYNNPPPFGPAALQARTRVSVFPAERCVSPLELFRRVYRAGSGAILMESAARGAPAGIRSLVIPQGVVRLVLHGERAIFSALKPPGERILEALSGRLKGALRHGRRLEARFPASPPDPALADEERLKSPSVLDAVGALAGLVEDPGPADIPPPGVYGVFSYEIVDRWEELPPRRPDPLEEPDAHWILALDAVLFDHLRSEVRLVTRSLSEDRGAEERHRVLVETLCRPGSPLRRPPDRPQPAEKEAEPDISAEDFLASVRRFLHHIEAGDIFQGVLSRGLAMGSSASPLAVYRALRESNPSPYMYWVDLPNGALLGAFPETCLKVEEGEVEIRPIAGTAPRGLGPDGGIDEELDSRLAVGLLLDSKEQAEHAMLVDLARNDVARVSVAGSRRVVDPFSIEKYSHVQHLVSRVRGRLLPGLNALHAYRASANMGTLTGAPKLRAMELIRETEPFSRGFYGGAVGYLLQDGSFDSCIVIRSLRYRSGVYLTRSGAGIVADSLPERELEETLYKARACRQAVACAESWGCADSAAEAEAEDLK